jgi:hypothetical protein
LTHASLAACHLGSYRTVDFVAASLVRARMPWLPRDASAVPTRAETVAAAAAVADAWGAAPPSRRVRALYNAFAAPLAGHGDAVVQRESPHSAVAAGWRLAGSTLQLLRPLPPLAAATLLLQCVLAEAMLRRAVAMGVRPAGGASVFRSRFAGVLAELARADAHWSYVRDEDVACAWRLAIEALGPEWQPPQ